MMQSEMVDVLIIGAGPAGISTALHLVQMDAGWAARMLVLDKAVHPREKLCGGGVTQTGLAILDALGLDFPAQHVPIRELRFQFGKIVHAIYGDPVFRVMHRAAFDHWLVREAESRGVSVRQGVAVTDVQPTGDFVQVVTERGTIRAKTVVIADGSTSFVRRKLGWAHTAEHPPLARLLEVISPEPTDHPLFAGGIAVFDFSVQREGVQGYVWDFPSLRHGQTMMNRGVFDSRVRAERPRAPLKTALTQAFSVRQRTLATETIHGHPIRWFDAGGNLARPRMLLAGDAAGVDPFVGEGISFALGYGQVAAQAIAAAFARGDFSFSDYGRRVLADPLLSQLPQRVKLARILYRIKAPRLLAMVWYLFPLIVRFYRLVNRNIAPFSAAKMRRVKPLW